MNFEENILLIISLGFAERFKPLSLESIILIREINHPYKVKRIYPVYISKVNNRKMKLTAESRNYRSRIV